MRSTFIAILLTLPHLAAEITPYDFNDQLRDDLEKFQSTLTTQELAEQLHLLSVLAKYIRIHKHFVHRSGGAPGYRHKFPEPIPDFDQGVAAACSVGNVTENVLMNCLHYFITQVMPKTNWAGRSITLLDRKLREEVTDSAFSEVVTFAQIMCWMTKNQMSFLEFLGGFNLKFFTKKAIEAHKYKWDGYLYDLNATGGPLVSNINMLNPFVAAERSFCPSVCEAETDRACFIEPYLNIDLAGMRENRWNRTFPCPSNNQIFRPDLDICVHKDTCLYTSCPANFICEEALPRVRCVCAFGYAPKKNAAGVNVCKPISLKGIHIPWTSPYHTKGAPINTMNLVLPLVVCFSLLR